MPSSRTRTLAEIALTVALSYVLAWASTIWRMPQGGTLSLAMAPIIVLALLRGVGPGVVAGIIFGLADYTVEPFFLRLDQFVLDYPIAFGVLGLAGLFTALWWRAARDTRWLRGILVAVLPGTVIAVLARYAVHVVSGILFFGSNAPEGQPVWIYSMVYNTVVLLAGIATFVVVALVMPPLSSALRARGSAPRSGDQ